MDHLQELDAFMATAGFPEAQRDAMAAELNTPLLSAEQALRVLRIGQTAFTEARRQADLDLERLPINWDGYSPEYRVDL